MNKLIVYVHGKNGSPAEADFYQKIFPYEKVIGFDYKSKTPWDAQKEFCKYFANYKDVVLIANSLGAFFSICSLDNQKIKKAFFISPIVNMEKLIADMMGWANVTESELREKREIQTAFGETLSWDYLLWARNNPIKWDVPTEILYGENDNLQSLNTVGDFAEKSNAKITIIPNGEHWFHTKEQMDFLSYWIKNLCI